MNKDFATLYFLILGGAGLSAAAAASTEALGPRDPGIDLPAGEGRAVLERSCTNCHDLAGLAAYKGYYDAGRWRALIDTMVSHGAQLDEAESALLTDYLVEHFGPSAR
jgi:cytochrome c5